MSGQRDVRIVIDRLVLRGVAPPDRRALAGAIEAELSQRLSVPGTSIMLDRSSVHSPSRDRITAHVPPGASTAAIGAAVARAIQGGMST